MIDTTQSKVSSEALRDATAEAARILTGPTRRRAAAAYLAQRGIDASSLPGNWPLGYAPPGWTRLVDELHVRGFGDGVLLDAGLARRCSRGTLIDVFRDRVIFSVHGQDGAIAGFIGRDLSGAPAAPKYINTAGTPLFCKGTLLYGLHEAGATNLRASRPVLVEGPLDVLAIAARAEQTGDSDLLPVATSGTAVTPTQARLIAETAARCSVPVVVAMDGDSAGRSAALAAGEQLRRHGADVRIALLPNGCDPADYLANPAANLDVFRQANAVPLLSVQLQRAIEIQGDRMQWVEGRLGATRTVAACLTNYPPEEAVARIDAIALALDVAPSTVLTALGAAYTKANALPPADTRVGELLRAASQPAAERHDALSRRTLSRAPAPAVSR
jgi:DNA primase